MLAALSSVAAAAALQMAALSDEASECVAQLSSRLYRDEASAVTTAPVTVGGTFPPNTLETKEPASTDEGMLLVELVDVDVDVVVDGAGDATVKPMTIALATRKMELVLFMAV
jgi:hypothetical protein